MDGNGYLLPVDRSRATNAYGTTLPNMPTIDDSEADVLNDETFGDCDLEAIKIKSEVKMENFLEKAMREDYRIFSIRIYQMGIQCVYRFENPL